MRPDIAQDGAATRALVEDARAAALATLAGLILGAIDGFNEDGAAKS